MNIITTFITNSQSTKLVQPGKCTLDHPAKDSQPTAVFRSAFCQNRIYTQFTQRISMGLTVISSVTLKTIRSLTRTTHLACNWRNRLNQRQKLSNIVAVSSSNFYRERDTVGIGDNVMFRPQFPSIRRIRTRFRPPKTARTEAESTTAREKSNLSFSRRLLSRMWCILSHIPAFCQSCRRRQQVMPEPQPISFGIYCQGMPVLSTKMIPVRALRSSTCGLPPFGRGGRLGRIGLMSFHNWSFTSGLAMFWSSLTKYQVLGFPMHVLSDKPLVKF
jgi:hypothetical protein